MPNHITTLIKIKASAEVQKEIIGFLHIPDPKDEDGYFNFDFNNLVPRPPELDVTSGSHLSDAEKKIHVENTRKFGYPTWYEWSIENWGTKWGAYQSSFEDGTISFQSAWSHPLPIMAKLFEKYPEVLFEVEYADEDTGYNLGQYTSEDLTNTGPNPGSKEAIAFALRVQGHSITEYCEDLEEDDPDPETQDLLEYLRSQIQT